ncbi:hypothetical protein PIB30_051825 [Stylosanthes scabra]|uniref:Transposase MuDR plant domain-containing protein n=1 Tax=Stylosanthes scabra TaxID=79078 RepID=A0ABU6WHL8_9FABA|nr:hypothetical protein [Stylosanthes scabra]
MSYLPLLSIHYDGEIIRAEDDSVIFRSPNPIFAYLPNEVRCLSSLKNLILNVTGQQYVKRVKKLYYRYPAVVENGYFYKRFSLRTDEEVDLAIYWHIHHPNIHLLELFAILIDVAERSSSSNASNTQSTDLARWLIRGMMIVLNITPEGSMHALNSTQDEVESHQISTRPSDPTDESFFVDPVLSDEEIDPAVLSEQEAAGMNYFTDSMNEHVSHVQRAPDDDPTTEFEVGQEFQNKEAVLMAVKTYSINRAVDYKILENDQLKCTARCIKQDQGCAWMIRVSYRRKNEI